MVYISDSFTAVMFWRASQPSLSYIIYTQIYKSEHITYA